MLPRLEAERALDRINEGAIAAGMAPKESKRTYLADLNKRAAGGGKRVKRQPSLAQLQAMGVPVALEPVPDGE